MQREAEVHSDIGRQDPAQRRRGIEDVAVGGADEREAAEQKRIPQRDPPVLPEELGGEVPKAVARFELIRPLSGQEL
jgi:hypothetical protein